eukprot:TRINITY_DN7153_c0_g1_i1.p1 TRINITY_DN7153_c0_g1~~TRINITY_DN7153_c0_g1_i1.p1  ORF type:complete len:465 (-),score=91.10 TRINITY_DN7153_c0_g1_i1:73-1467(-)
MKLLLALSILCLVCFDLSSAGTVRAGVAKIDGTLPIGIPLAGYNHAQRRYEYWPLIKSTPYTNWMTPSVGIMDPTWVKALVIDDGEGTQMCIVTVDAIGSDENLVNVTYNYAKEMGFPVPLNNCIFSMSHSHSGPGAVSSDFLWQFAPATDLFQPALQRQLAYSMATAMMQAYDNLAPVQFAIGSFNLTGVTQNRRAHISPYVQPGTIDPHLGLIRVDDLKGNPIATVWNYAIHGVCYGPENMNVSGDIMGKTCQVAESVIGGVVLFMNADAGDVDPTPQTCSDPPNFTGATTIAKAIATARQSMTTTTQLSMIANSQIVDFGPTDLNYTLARFNNCTKGGFMDICSLCAFLDCDLNAHLNEAWLENTPRFLAVSFVVGKTKTVLISVPGEALVELGWWIRNDTLDLGFDATLFGGYSNAHMGYFATPDEYDIGGYESQLTFWGIETAAKIRAAVKNVASTVVP